MISPTEKEKAEEWDEWVRRAHAKYRNPNICLFGPPKSNYGLELIANLYVNDIRKSRQTDRRGKK